MPDRLTGLAIAYLLLPVLVFLATWPAVWVSIPTLAVGALALATAPGRTSAWRRPAGQPFRAMSLCLVLGLLWGSLAGTHHLFYATDDWQIRDAVLRDLVAFSWPLTYAIEGGESALRTPMGYYLVAALAGKVAGMPAAQAVLWAWTGFGLALVLVLLRSLTGGGRAFAIGALVFAGFGGLEAGVLMLRDVLQGLPPARELGHSLEWWAVLFQYSGHNTLVAWAPNHALPGWIPLLLLLRHFRRAAFLRGWVAMLAAAVFWGPLSVVGLVVFFLAAALRLVRCEGWGAVVSHGLSVPNLLALPGIALPVAAFVVAGTGSMPLGLIYDNHPALYVAKMHAALLLVEVLPWAVVTLLLLRSRFVSAATVFLCVLPIFTFGPGNELVMRGGIPALAVLAVSAGIALGRPGPRGVRAILAAVTLIALFGALNEASPVLTRQAWASSRDCTVVEAWQRSAFRDANWSHYLAPWASLESWLRSPGMRMIPMREDVVCWPAQAQAGG
jgi:hypothetical protein